jgi:hypothetical protein
MRGRFAQIAQRVEASTDAGSGRPGDHQHMSTQLTWRRRLEQLGDLAESDETTVALLPEVWAVAPMAVLLLVALALLPLRLIA